MIDNQQLTLHITCEIIKVYLR